MATQYKLYAKELSAHYPMMWNAIDEMALSKVKRKYPVVLDYIMFCINFEDWVALFADVVSYSFNVKKPLLSRQKDYGVNTNIPIMLEFVVEYIPRLQENDAELANTFIDELAEWRRTILLRTASGHTPRYNQKQKCPACNNASLMKQNNILYCGNVACVWVQV